MLSIRGKARSGGKDRNPPHILQTHTQRNHTTPHDFFPPSRDAIFTHRSYDTTTAVAIHVKSTIFTLRFFRLCILFFFLQNDKFNIFGTESYDCGYFNSDI